MEPEMGEGFRLSPQQRRLWAVMAADEEAAERRRIYRAQVFVELDPTVDLEIVQRALERLVEQHEILRTRFVCLSGMTVPLQVVGESAPRWRQPLVVEDGGEARIERRFEARKEDPFALADGLLIDVEPVILPGGRHGLLIALPALCCDAVSLDLLLDQLASIYREIESGVGDESGEEEMQYIDLAEWQNELLETAEPEERALWQDRRLWDAAWTALPGRRHRPSPGAFSPLTLELSLPEPARVAIAAHERAPEHLLLTCWQLQLARLAGRGEITVGAMFSGRRYAELETAPGLFERHLPLHLEIDPQRTFADLASELARRWQQAEEAQELFAPGDLLAAAEARGEAPHLPFGFEFRSASQRLENTLFSVRQRFVCTDAFDLRLGCRAVGDELVLELAYDPRHYPEDAVRSLAEQLMVLVENATTAPETPVQQLSSLGPAERRRLLFDWNAPSGIASALPLHRRFEEQARIDPASLALVDEETRLSRGEWNRRADQLAHHLRRRFGVGPDDLVAICLERSAASLVALLAVHKAGAAYVVLDPAQPLPRLALMLEELEGPPLVTRAPLVAELDLPPASWTCLDRDQQAIAAEPESDLEVEIDLASLAYVLFTSGSSGRPKGVGVEHRQLLNYLDGLLARLEPPPGASYATVSTLAADLGNSALFPAIATGGCLHLVSLERATDPRALGEYVERQAIDYLKVVPSHLRALLDSPSGAQILPRRALLVGGELFRWQLAESVAAKASSEMRLFNHYGPTETTVGVLTGAVETGAGAASSGATVPLGRPIGNTRIYVLDPALEPVPVGFGGELLVGGDSVSRGYLRRPGQTARVFVPDPWAGGDREPGARLYRTGDRVRWLPSGAVEYLGRIDQQIKIRGFRIELGEVEAILTAHPRVDQAVAVVRRDDAAGQDDQGRGEARLVAYVVAVSPTGAGDLGRELRRWASQRLPPYMVPGAFVQLETLPLSPNGKVDRGALPAPEVELSRAKEGAVAPETPIEEILAHLWRSLLEVEQVAVDDSFLELGGHSLSAMQLITRVREICGVEVPLGDFLVEPTIAALASRVERALRLGGGGQLPEISRAEATGGALPPLSFSQERYWLWRHPQPNTVSRNELAAFRLEGALDVDRFRRTIGRIIARHQILRTSYRELAGHAVQIVHHALEVRMPFVDLTALPTDLQDGELRRYIDRQDARLFDLEAAPVFRLTLFRLAADQHLFLFVMHHIAVDGWSWAILKKEMAQLYGAMSAAGQSPLPDLPIQYQDFARWQRRHLSGEVWERQLQYWRDQLAGVIPSPDVPTDRPRPRQSSYRGAVERFELQKPLIDKLEALSRQQNATLFITLLTAFKTVLRHYTGEPELSVLSLFANRNRPEIENLVGCFMNVLPLRTRLDGIETFSELLAAVRTTTLGAYSRPDIPFDRLVREVVLPQLPEKVHELFVFRILFALGGSPELAAEPSELKIDLTPVKSDRMYNDFLIRLRPFGDHLVCTIKYNTDLFDRERVVKLGEDYLQVLEAVTENPDLRLDAALKNTALEKA